MALFKLLVSGVILVRMRENVDQNNPQYGLFLSSEMNFDIKLY